VEEPDPLTEKIIGCAIEVHRAIGPGLLEAIYEEALCIEFEEKGLCYKRQLPIPIFYKGRRLGDYRLDLIVQDAVIVEIKSVERFDAAFEAQILTYLRAAQKKVGLLIKFNSRLMRDGIRRYSL
jgi:GxxExxY protein